MSMDEDLLGMVGMDANGVNPLLGEPTEEDKGAAALVKAADAEEAKKSSSSSGLSLGNLFGGGSKSTGKSASKGVLGGLGS